MRGRTYMTAPALILLVLLTTATAQQIQIDRGVEVAGLWCFPLNTDTTEYRFLPNDARIATTDDGKPIFSLIRYVLSEQPEYDGAETIVRAEGGAALNFEVLYETPEDKVKAAERSLRELLESDSIDIVGPVIFDHATYAVVSSIILDGQEGDDTSRVIHASGQAPIVQGSEIPLSFSLGADQSTLLLSSLMMDPSDLSIVFELSFSGLTDAYHAKMIVDWSRLASSQSFSAGGSIYWVSADVERAVTEAFDSSYITLQTAGSDGAMEGLVNRAYDKVVDLLFRPLSLESVPPDQKGHMMDAVAALIDPKSGILSSRKTTGFGLNAAYQLKEMRTTGQSIMNFNSRATVERTHFITLNAGNLYHQYGDDTTLFKDVVLSDPTFDSRRITVCVDGELLPEFDDMINSVTVTIRKEHQSGETTLKEVVISAVNFSDTAYKPVVVSYNNDHDDDRLQWLEFEISSKWHFQGGGTYEVDWQKVSSPVVCLFAPFHRHRVYVECDPDRLAQQHIRFVELRITYPFFDKTRTISQVYRANNLDTDTYFELTMPLGVTDYDYLINWALDDNRQLSKEGATDMGFLFIDELPAP